MSGVIFRIFLNVLPFHKKRKASREREEREPTLRTIRVSRERGSVLSRRNGALGETLSIEILQ